MINLQLSVREAMNLATNCHQDIYERIVTAFEVALGMNQRRMVTITSGMNLDNRIPCIKAIRLHTGWGLKEAKEWTDFLIGRWNNYNPCSTKSNSITLKSPEAAENLLRDLVALGCEGFLS